MSAAGESSLKHGLRARDCSRAVHLGDKIRAQMWAEQPWQGETLAIDAVAIARHWPQIGGLDFG